MRLHNVDNLQRPRGTRDQLPEEMKKRREVESKLYEVSSLFGFQPIRTPIFENLEFNSMLKDTTWEKYINTFKRL